MEETFLSDEFIRQLMSVGEVDLLVGISSHNNAKTIGQVVQAAEEISLGAFRRERVVIVNADGGSTDSTREIVLGLAATSNGGTREVGSLRTLHRIATRYADAPSSGRALHTILAAAELLRAKACVVVSGAIEEMQPALIERLLQHVYRENFDYAVPLYSRSKFDGLLTRTLLYPLNRALYGYRLRELHAQEFAFSGRLASQCLSRRVWQDELLLQGAEVWMTVTAVTSGFRFCQSFLGPRPVLGSSPDLVTAVRQTVGGLFRCMESTESFWIDRTGCEAVPSFGPEHELSDKPAPGDREIALERYRNGVNELSEMLAIILQEETFREIRQIASLQDADFRMEDALWVKVVYEFAASCHLGVLNRDHLIQALVPIYRGWIASFLLQHLQSTPEELEAATESLCLEFERQKPYLIERWKAKERGKP